MHLNRFVIQSKTLEINCNRYVRRPSLRIEQHTVELCRVRLDLIDLTRCTAKKCLLFLLDFFHNSQHLFLNVIAVRHKVICFMNIL